MTADAASWRPPLEAWLVRAQRLGLVGPGAVGDHVDQAERFAAAIPSGAGRILDLGSGGGLPGLVLAQLVPEAELVLLDAKERAVSALRGAIVELGLADRVRAEGGRAEVLAHDPAWRERFPVVVCRSFGPPAVVAECATGFVAVGGRLLVSEPPGAQAGDRWPVEDHQALGLAPPSLLGGIAVLEKVRAAGADIPRGVGIPSRRPLF